jgi:carbon monoxide dehydrogenase subunit G
VRFTRELQVQAPLEDAWAAVAEPPAGGWVRATLDDLDDDEHVAGFHVEARERDGYGTAVGTITSRLRGEGQRTRLSLEADLAVSGTERAMGDAVLEDFARGLEQRLPSEPAGGRRLAVAGGAVLVALLIIWRLARR